MKKSKTLGLTTKLLSVCCVLFVLTFSLTTARMQTTFNEGFEAGGKTAYAAANVTLGSGSWYLDDALTGNLAQDVRIGSYAARMRNTGKMHMNFNVTSAGTVAISYAIYGADGASNWELWQSVDSGVNFTKVGSTVTDASTTLKTAYFTVNSGSAIRFEIRKTTGGSNRLDFDDISLATNSGSTSEHMEMGNPSGAVHDTAVPTNYLMEKAQYV